MKINLPQTVTAADFRKFAAPDETLAVRVLVRRTGNTGNFTLRGGARRYVATRDDKVGCHTIEVPLSLWMHGVVVDGVYRDNLSVCHDLQANRQATKAPLVMLVVPWRHAKHVEVPSERQKGQVPKEQPMQAFRELLVEMRAPEVILSAFDLLGSDRDPVEIEATLRDSIKLLKDLSDSEDGDPESQEETNRRGDPPYASQLTEEQVALLMDHPEDFLSFEDWPTPGARSYQEMFPHAATESPGPQHDAREGDTPASGTPAGKTARKVAKKAAKNAKTNAQRQKEHRDRRKREKEEERLAAAAGAIPAAV